MSSSNEGFTPKTFHALASLLVPGLGQLIQGRLARALNYLVLALLIWIVLSSVSVHYFWGVLLHVLAALDAALWKGGSR